MLNLSESACSDEKALCTAVKCGFGALKEGGKMVVCSWMLPSLDKGKTMNRMAVMATGDVKHYDKLLKRSNNFFMDMAICLVKYQIS